MIDKKLKKRILLRLSNGVTTIDDLDMLISLFYIKYKTEGKTIKDFIEWQSYSEMRKRLLKSVFSNSGNSYPLGYRKYCIYGEHHNTKLFIKLSKKIIQIGQQRGDISKPEFYGLPDHGYKIPLETLIHILLRHNKNINSLLNKDSITNGYNPSSFGNGTFTEPMLIMLMALNILEKDDWKHGIKGKNLICNFRVGGQAYSLIRNGNTKEIKTFYPRNDNNNVTYIELERNPEKMEFFKK